MKHPVQTYLCRSVVPPSACWRSSECNLGCLSPFASQGCYSVLLPHRASLQRNLDVTFFMTRSDWQIEKWIFGFIVSLGWKTWPVNFTNWFREDRSVVDLCPRWTLTSNLNYKETFGSTTIICGIVASGLLTGFPRLDCLQEVHVTTE
jgi:hypothetical protein